MFTLKSRISNWSFCVFYNLSKVAAKKGRTTVNLSRQIFASQSIGKLRCSHQDKQSGSISPTPGIQDVKVKKRPTLFDVQPDRVKMEDIAFTKINPEMYSDVILHLRYNFFADEPLNKSLGLCEPGQPHDELEEFSMNILSQGVSFMAILKNSKKVVGALLNGVECEAKPSSYDMKMFKDKKLQKIFDFLKNVGNDVEMLTHYNLSSIFELKIISVDYRLRGRGIAKKLYEMAETYARDKGFQLLRTDATALYSQKLFEKYGFTTLKKISYAQYPTPEAPLFNVEPPHVAFKLMVKKLD